MLRGCWSFPYLLAIPSQGSSFKGCYGVRSLKTWDTFFYNSWFPFEGWWFLNVDRLPLEKLWNWFGASVKVICFCCCCLRLRLSMISSLFLSPWIFLEDCVVWVVGIQLVYMTYCLSVWLSSIGCSWWPSPVTLWTGYFGDRKYDVLKIIFFAKYLNAYERNVIWSVVYNISFI